jgi:hypothetical protein
MKSDKLIFPDKRGDLNPYSLLCTDCGNVELFYYDEIKTTLITIKDGTISYDFGRFVRKAKTDARVATVVRKHIEMGAGHAGGLLLIKDNVRCARCEASTIVLYGDVIAECQDNRCVGCFRCGGAYNEENILKTCVKCVDIRRQVSEDQAMFMITLDMDLFCDACPLDAIRDEYNITGDEVKTKAGGRY